MMSARELVFWFRGITRALFQLRIRKPTFGGPRLEVSVRSHWAIASKKGMWPDLDEISRSGEDELALTSDKHNPQPRAEGTDV